MLPEDQSRGKLSGELKSVQMCCVSISLSNKKSHLLTFFSRTSPGRHKYALAPKRHGGTKPSLALGSPVPTCNTTPSTRPVANPKALPSARLPSMTPATLAPRNARPLSNVHRFPSRSSPVLPTISLVSLSVRSQVGEEVKTRTSIETYRQGSSYKHAHPRSH